MMVRFEEDEYTALAIFDAGKRIQTMEAIMTDRMILCDWEKLTGKVWR